MGGFSGRRAPFFDSVFVPTVELVPFDADELEFDVLEVLAFFEDVDVETIVVGSIDADRKFALFPLSKCETGIDISLNFCCKAGPPYRMVDVGIECTVASVVIGGGGGKHAFKLDMEYLLSNVGCAEYFEFTYVE